MIILHIFESPVSLLLAAGLLIFIYILFKTQSLKKISGLLSSQKTSVLLLAVTAGLLIIEGTWGLPIHKNMGFFAVVILLMVSLGLVVMKGFKGKSLVFTLSHLGLFLVLFGGFFGAPDFEDARMICEYRKPNHVACANDGELLSLPFEVKLDDFKIDYYEDGKSPKQYTSYLTIDGKQYTTSVNHPCHILGYTLYQADYDWTYGEYSVLLVVRDPWLPVVYLGFVILILSSVLQMRKTWKSRATLPAVVALAVVFTIISLARINLGTLMPALRSLWFVPHLIVYMLAYSILAIALILGVVSFFKTKGNSYDLSYKLFQTSSCLLLVGMVCGAVWAKAAWGDYWTWDPKENWAAATWLFTLIGSHIPNRNKNKIAVIVALIISFAAIQMTWYGVNYLPSSTASMHTYNN